MFLTGVSKYGKVSIFSDLNNLNDLTLSKPMAAIAGFTQDELDQNMAEHIAATAGELGMELDAFRHKLKVFYNGYSWDGHTRVYNPFSINKFFFDREFLGHWYSTGTPTMLIKLFQQLKHPPYEVDGQWANDSLMSKLSLESPLTNSPPCLWQTGYLTILKKDTSFMSPQYLLGFPNYEVKSAFLSNLWQHYTDQAEEGNFPNRMQELRMALLAGDLNQFFTQFQGLMATIPYQLFVKQEAYYHTLVYLVMELSGLKAMSEVASSSGRADTVLETKDAVYVFEFKLSSVTDALNQIKEKGYHLPYQGQGKKIVLVGVAFDTETRKVAGWLEEVVEK